MYTIHRRPTAEKDIEDIIDYIAENNRQNAINFIKKIENKLNTLAKYPYIGRVRNELQENLHSFPIDNYIVFYFPLENGIEVVRIIHCARDLSSIFQN